MTYYKPTSEMVSAGVASVTQNMDGIMRGEINMGQLAERCWRAMEEQREANESLVGEIDRKEGDAPPEMPESPNADVLWVIRHMTANKMRDEDRSRGKEMQWRLGSSVVPMKMEYEDAAGKYARIRDAVIGVQGANDDP